MTESLTDQRLRERTAALRGEDPDDLRGRLNRMEQRLEGVEQRMERMERSQARLTELIEKALGITDAVQFPTEPLTQIKVQLFDNRERNAAVKAARALGGKDTGAFFPSFNLVTEAVSGKANAFTRRKPLELHLHPHNTAHTRSKLKDDLDYLQLDETAQLVGCLVVGKQRFADQAAIIHRDNRLVLVIYERAYDLGLPRLRPDDAEKNAAVMRWRFPDPYRRA